STTGGSTRSFSRAGRGFRASVAARGFLHRHTPPLAGDPPSLDPAENHRLHRHTHQTDYARSGDWVFEDSTRTPAIRIEDHPRLATIARSVTRTVYGTDADRSPLLFSS